ncbi:hypothetical protein [Sphingobacterium suaedae]|uniref:Uncharacterized protein n=1 Tax=Sphingobacterium suaedae TaxID=1686402 RepID=A0ABW5KPQ5_9SPHI
MEKEIRKKLEENGEVIHRDYFGTVRLNEDRYFVYWVPQGYIEEFDVCEDDDPVKVVVNVAHIKNGEIAIPESVLDYIPTTYKHIKDHQTLPEFDDLVAELKQTDSSKPR